MPNNIVHPDAPSTQVPRAQGVEIAYGVRLSLTTLPSGERQRVEDKLTSLATLKRLAKAADRGGADGQLFIADVSAGLRAVFRITTAGAEVVSLISKRAFRQLSAGPKPLRYGKAAKGKRPNGPRTKHKFPLT